MYDLTDEDFSEETDGALVRFERVDRSEAYNHVTVEFLNRENEYNQEQAEFKIQSDINRRGLKSMSTQDLHCLQTKARAQYAAANIANESMYSRTVYSFGLDWSKCLLEPGDIVTITTNAGLTLNRKIVEITEIEEGKDGTLDVKAVEKNIGAGAPALYQSQDAGREGANMNQLPSDTQTPVFYHYPTTEQIIGIAVCGENPARWGGCEVWASVDGDTYEYMGDVTAPSRYGKLLAAMTATDTVADVELYDSNLQLLPVSYEAAEADSALCLIGQEWVSYEGAELTGKGQYRLSGVRRGRIGTAATDHDEGANFLRHDQVNGFKWNYYEKDIGQALYIKLPAKNIFGLNVQELDNLTVYQFTVSAAGQTLTERQTVMLETDDWTAFAFETAFSVVPELFWVDAPDFGTAAYFRNLTATGFEGRLLDIATGQPTAGNLFYEAQGR